MSPEVFPPTTPSPRAPETSTPRRRPRQLAGRPRLYTSYSQNLRLFNTRPKQLWVLGMAVGAFLLTWMADDPTLRILALACAAAIGAIGLNIVTGYAGQVSLGHAFFLAVGAYTASALSGDPDGSTIGFGITEVLIWLPAAGLVAAAFGVLVAPLATRLRGLYLAIVTLGLVFIGEHVLSEWTELSGGAQIGRAGPVPTLFGADLAGSDDLFTGEQKLYLLILAALIVLAVLARNLARSKAGRAFAAIRDRDVAASVMGVNLSRYKMLAFAISSFYAGCAGALLYSVGGVVEPTSFNLLLSVQYIAMVLIGGVATISGSIMGALFITLLEPLTRQLPDLLPFISTNPSEPFNVFQVEGVLYGLLIIGFLLFEPRGLYGIWLRIRNYWKAWPFSY